MLRPLVPLSLVSLAPARSATSIDVHIIIIGPNLIYVAVINPRRLTVSYITHLFQPVVFYVYICDSFIHSINQFIC